MRNSAFEPRGTRAPTTAELLHNPVVTNIVRMLLIAIFALGGYIWKTEMDHVNRALQEIKTGVDGNIARQWSEIRTLRQDVTQVNKDVQRALLRSNELLAELAARPRAGR